MSFLVGPVIVAEIAPYTGCDLTAAQARRLVCIRSLSKRVRWTLGISRAARAAGGAASHKFATAVRAFAGQDRRRALVAEGAFEGAYMRISAVRRQIRATALAIGFDFEHLYPEGEGMLKSLVQTQILILYAPPVEAANQRAIC
jgi:hypothetical protein